MVAAGLLALCLWSARDGARADCHGSDIFAELEAGAPSLYGEIERAAREMPFGGGTLFRLHRPGTPPSYVVATLHVRDPRLRALPAAVAEAVRNSRTILVELAGRERSGEAGRLGAGGQLDAAPDQQADRLLGDVDMAQLSRLAAERGIAPRALRTYSAGVLAFMLDLPRCATAQPGQPDDTIEGALARIAKEAGARLVGLETLEEQVSIAAGLSRRDQGELLVAAIRHAERGVDVVETSVRRFVAGDLGSLLAWMRSQEPIPGRADSRFPPAFMTALIDQRNRRMAERAIPYLQEGRAVLAVGAAHLPGREGLLSLLHDHGFAVESVR